MVDPIAREGRDACGFGTTSFSVRPCLLNSLPSGGSHPGRKCLCSTANPIAWSWGATALMTVVLPAPSTPRTTINRPCLREFVTVWDLFGKERFRNGPFARESFLGLGPERFSRVDERFFSHHSFRDIFRLG